jgi:hypothetical protein
VGVLPPQVSDELQTIGSGKLLVRDDEIRAIRESERFFRRTGLVDIETRGMELELNYPAELFFVLDYKHSLFHRLGRI